VPIAAAVAAAAARDLPERDGFVGVGAESATTAGTSGGGAGLERDEVDFDAVALEAADVLGVAAFGLVAFEAAGVLAVGVVFAAAAAFGDASAFAVAVAFFSAGAFFSTDACLSTGAFLSAATALEGAADLRVAFGLAAGSP
jgi:hypothetical protein